MSKLKEMVNGGGLVIEESFHYSQSRHFPKMLGKLAHGIDKKKIEKEIHMYVRSKAGFRQNIIIV